MFISGGDDQKLNLLQLENNQLTHVASCMGHNTAVTAVQIFGKMVLTTGTDQRLNIWKLEHEELILLASCCLELADVVDMKVIKQESRLQVLLVGSGLQIVEIEEVNEQ